MKWPVRAIGDPRRWVALDRRQLRRIEFATGARQVEGHEVRVEILDLAGEVAELPRLRR